MLFTCKMCGGQLEEAQSANVAICPYCGTKQTISKTRDDTVSNLFCRANDLRLRCEFDKAEEVYSEILNIDNTDSEAHWGIVLCKYGIEYVEKPNTDKKVPTCHRTLYDTVLTDLDYLDAIKYADDSQRAMYSLEAAEIDRLQREIKVIVNNEAPFDVFICYKETDENGERTIDSVLANDIYHQLTQAGYKVFFAAITLESKLGQEYEPYIFAALNTAKVMLVLGTKPEYFEAVWVKNEWSRFLKFMKTDHSKLLIPCYRDMNAYNLPKEFAYLQAQDMSKIGFINDVIYGIKKVIGNKSEPAPKPTEQSAPVPTPMPQPPALDKEEIYHKACVFASGNNIMSWQEAIQLCDKIPGYKDIDVVKNNCYNRIKEAEVILQSEHSKNAEEYIASKKKLKFIKRMDIITWIIVFVLGIICGNNEELTETDPFFSALDDIGSLFALLALIFLIWHIVYAIKHKRRFNKFIKSEKAAKKL